MIYIYKKKKQEQSPLVSATVVRDNERHWTPIYLDFFCKNVNALVAKIVKLDGSHEGGESGDWGSIAYCADPFCNGFCIINE